MQACRQVCSRARQHAVHGNASARCVICIPAVANDIPQETVIQAHGLPVCSLAAARHGHSQHADIHKILLLIGSAQRLKETLAALMSLQRWHRITCQEDKRMYSNNSGSHKEDPAQMHRSPRRHGLGSESAAYYHTHSPKDLFAYQNLLVNATLPNAPASAGNERVSLPNSSRIPKAEGPQDTSEPRNVESNECNNPQASSMVGNR